MCHVYSFGMHLVKILLISDIDECIQPNNCNVICHNIEGSFFCTGCSRKTEYDSTKMQCTRRKQQTLLLGKNIMVTFDRRHRTLT